MDIEVWHIWIIVSIILLIVEVFASSFLAICLAIGCLTSAFTAYFNFDIKVQLFAFSVGTLIAFFTVRPLMLKYFHSKGNKIKTNADALVGKIGRVVETIDFEKNQGRVVVEGDDWRAQTLNSETINAGEKVEVVAVNSTILIVKLFVNNI
jgi:membrane protein implicated in regulation of membrane protease activity